MKLILEKKVFNIEGTKDLAIYFYNNFLKNKKNITIFLEGGLGVGKTLITRTILQESGIKDEIPSPTYTFIQEYKTQSQTFAHFDFYRFNNPKEFFARGFDEIAESEIIKLVEWPEKITPETKKGFTGEKFVIKISHGVGVGMRKIRILTETPINKQN